MQCQQCHALYVQSAAEALSCLLTAEECRSCRIVCGPCLGVCGWTADAGCLLDVPTLPALGMTSHSSTQDPTGVANNIPVVTPSILACWPSPGQAGRQAARRTTHGQAAKGSRDLGNLQTTSTLKPGRGSSEMSQNSLVSIVAWLVVCCVHGNSIIVLRMCASYQLHCTMQCMWTGRSEWLVYML